MSVAKVATGIVVLGLGVLFWQKHQQNAEKAALAAVSDVHGFAALASPEGADPRKVWIVAAVNCPKEGARRADELARQLAERDIAFVRRSNVSFSLTEEDREIYGQIEKIMNSEVPIVFVNGRMKANPDFDEVVAEYDAAQL